MNQPITQDSRPDTVAHIQRVKDLLFECRLNLSNRGDDHDLSKLEEPEKSAFDRLKALSLSGMVYGSEEYRACLRAEKPAIQHHYAHNSHHPEFYPKHDGGVIAALLRACADAQEEQAKGAPAEDREEAVAVLQLAKFSRSTADQLESEINGMSLFDVLEMLMDWKAATERMKDGGDICASLIHNVERFKISPQLANILLNTIVEMKWPKPESPCPKN